MTDAHTRVTAKASGMPHRRRARVALCTAAALLLTVVLWTGVAQAAPQAVSYSVITLPGAGYQSIYDFIAGAKKSIEITVYALSDTKAQEALKAAAKRGVKVRVLLNSSTEGGAAGKTMSQTAYDDLTANGVAVRWAWSGTLWHQKTIVRDGTAAAIMTCNLYSPYYAVVRDYVVFTTNRTTAQGIQATFNIDWNNTDRAPVAGVAPAGSELVWSPGAEPALLRLIDSARPGTTIYIEDEQLASDPLEQALIAAVDRGVTVDFLMTYDPAFKDGLDTLAAGGVDVRILEGYFPLYIHAKVVSVNGETIFVGSTNLTSLMTDKNRNVGIITRDSGVVEGITSTIATDFAGAVPYTTP